MRSIDIIRQNRESVLERWFQSVLDTYPSDTSKFLRNQKDQFANPVGNTIRAGLGRILDGLAEGLPPAELARPLDDIVRIRAVQEFSPSVAVRFVFDLAGILREEAGTDGLPAQDRAALEAGLEGLALLAFDTYMGCREKLFEIRVREIKEQQLLAVRTGSLGKAGARPAV